VEVGQDVTVVGGGSTAMDAARVAKRLGAKNVRVIYRRTRAEMPAQPEELIDAEEEGIGLDFLVNPVRIEGKQGKVTGIVCLRTELKDFDDSGRRLPAPIPGSEFTIPTDLIVPCLGQKLRNDFDGAEVKQDRRGQVVVDPDTLNAGIPGVFAGGDAVNPSTVIESVAQGRLAAIQIDKYFGYDGKLFAKERKPVAVSYPEEPYLKTIPQTKPHLEAVEKRIRSLATEVSKGLTMEEAIEEARRCLHCDRNEPGLTSQEESYISRIDAVL
jgi:NADPH-dependent glutamate synthase beta subunit-like oxidoreductase